MFEIGGKRRAPAAAASRVRRWVEEALGIDETTIVMVTELACHEPGCPPLETVVAVLGGPAVRSWKIPGGIADLNRAELDVVLARPSDPVRHDHALRMGCCPPPVPPGLDRSGPASAQPSSPGPSGDSP